MRRACFPGSFDPPTIGHRAIVEAVLERDVDRVDLVLSTEPLGKPRASAVDERVATLETLLHGHPAVVLATGHRLIVDIAQGYDVVVVGADKWAQVNDPAWYEGSVDERDAALSALPRVLVVPRQGIEVVGDVEVLDLDPQFHAVSSTAVRNGRDDWRWR